MALVTTRTLLPMVMFAHVQVVLMVTNVKLTIDPVNQPLVGTMVSVIFFFSTITMIFLKVYVMKLPIKNLSVHVKMVGQVIIVNRW
jgi:hypothetical protein